MLGTAVSTRLKYSLTSAMEPLLVVLLGAVIGTMVVCLYLPMFSIYQHIQS